MSVKTNGRKKLNCDVFVLWVATQATYKYIRLIDILYNQNLRYLWQIKAALIYLLKFYQIEIKDRKILTVFDDIIIERQHVIAAKLSALNQNTYGNYGLSTSLEMLPQQASKICGQKIREHREKQNMNKKQVTLDFKTERNLIDDW